MICCLVQRSSQQDAADKKAGSGTMAEVVRSQGSGHTSAGCAGKSVAIVQRTVKENTITNKTIN